jgi:hypothetical protein
MRSDCHAQGIDFEIEVYFFRPQAYNLCIGWSLPAEEK